MFKNNFALETLIKLTDPTKTKIIKKYVPKPPEISQNPVLKTPHKWCGFQRTLAADIVPNPRYNDLSTNTYAKKLASDIRQDPGSRNRIPKDFMIPLTTVTVIDGEREKDILIPVLQGNFLGGKSYVLNKKYYVEKIFRTGNDSWKTFLPSSIRKKISKSRNKQFQINPDTALILSDYFSSVLLKRITEIDLKDNNDGNYKVTNDLDDVTNQSSNGILLSFESDKEIAIEFISCSDSNFKMTMVNAIPCFERFPKVFSALKNMSCEKTFLYLCANDGMQQLNEALSKFLSYHEFQ